MQECVGRYVGAGLPGRIHRGINIYCFEGVGLHIGLSFFAQLLAYGWQNRHSEVVGEEAGVGPENGVEIF